MTVEIDPDLRLSTRLALGGKTHMAWIGALSAAGAAAVYSIEPLAVRDEMLNSWDRLAIFGSNALPPLLLMFAPVRATTRLLELDERGLLDQMRLCGRPAGRVLVAFFAGSVWPLVAVSALFVLAQFRFVPAGHPVLFALLMFLGSSVVALLMYGLAPRSMVRHSGFIAPFQLLVSGTIVGFASDWVQHLSFSDRRTHVAFAATITALFVAIPFARRRLIRPVGRVMRRGSGIGASLARALPRSGPPELARQLRVMVFSGGVLWLQIAAPIAIAVIARLGPGNPAGLTPAIVGSIPFFLLLAAAFIISATASQIVRSGALELIAATPQRAARVAASLYGAVALPFWTATLLAALFVAAFVTLDLRDESAYWSLLAMAAAAVPAVSLAEGVHGRLPASWIVTPVVVIGLTQILSVVYRGSSPAGRAFDRAKWTGDTSTVQIAVIGAWLVAMSIASVAGRLRRASGPSLSPLWAAAGVVGAGLALRVYPIVMFPRMFPALLTLLVPFAAEEHALLSAPAERLVFVMPAAFVTALLAAGVGGLGWGAGIAAGAAGSFAVGTALLIHELTWHHRAASLALRVVVAALVMRVTPSVIRSVASIGETSFEVPVLIQPLDLVWLAGAFAIAFTLHHRRRLA